MQDQDQDRDQEKSPILVTGASGFLGKALTKALLKEGYKVRAFVRGDYPELTAMGVDVRRGDIANEAALLKAARGCHAIFHVAAKAGVWGSYESYYRPNVIGTRNVVRVQKACQIKYLVYTSSPSITFDGTDQEGIDESAPYASSFLSHYQKTKARAEAIVLNHNSDNFKTVSLRPHLIWGPGDNQLAPRIISLHKRGRLKLIEGGLKKVDAVYIDNAVKAHILAYKSLLQEKSPVAGKAYFITNHEPWPLADIINGILLASGQNKVTKSVSAFAAYLAGLVLENVYKILRIASEPPMTRFVAKQLATSHWYKPKKAQLELGYHPEISMKEGMKRLEESFV